VSCLFLIKNDLFLLFTYDKNINLINEKKYFEELLRLVAKEKQTDFEQYKEVIEKLSMEDRKKQGYTWHPLNIIKSGYTIGDRSFVLLEKANETHAPRQFRSGKTVRLFTLTPGVYQPEKIGIINYVKKNRMKIVLNTKDLPDWIGDGNIGIDLQFDERTYLEMEKALNTVMKANKDRLAELRSVLLGNLPSRTTALQPASIDSLNPHQNQAVAQILGTQDVAVIHGPPGTGKTTTLVQAIKSLAKKEHGILVCAPSNAAVDLLTERLAAEELIVVRIGNISRVDEGIIQHTLEAKLSNHPESKNIKKIKIQAANARKKAKQFKRKFGHKERMERNELFKESKELTAWVNQLEERLLDQILESAHVITCTLVGSTHKALSKKKFKTICIDEAAQALEPASWIPILKASRVILAGDPFQLPPTVKSRSAQKEGLNVTLIEKCLDHLSTVNLLKTQYRMNEAIMGFSNQEFYNNELTADESVKDHQLALDPEEAIQFIDTAGCGFEEKVNPKFASRYNPDEFQILCEHLYQLHALYKEQEVEMPSIGIISPYKEQAVYMRNQIEEDPLLEGTIFSVNTIDSFQGQERDIIYISLVRSNDKGEIGFLKDYRRMNVAMTRAKKKLVVIGDSATIGSDPFYSKFLDYCDKYGAYKTAWEYMQ